MSAAVIDEEKLAEFYVSDLMDWRAAFTRAGFHTISQSTLVRQSLLARTYTTDICRGTSHVRLEITEGGLSEPDSTGVSIGLELALFFGIEVERGRLPVLRRSPGFERIRCKRYVAQDSNLRLLVKGITKLFAFLARHKFRHAEDMVNMCLPLFNDSGSSGSYRDIPLEEVDKAIERVIRDAAPCVVEAAKPPVARDRHGRQKRKPEPEPVAQKSFRGYRRKKVFRRKNPNA